MSVYPFLVYVILIQCAFSMEPGFKVRITEKGIHYAGKGASQALQRNVLRWRLPHTSGEINMMKYNISSMRIVSISGLRSVIQFHEKSGLIWNSSTECIIIQGKYNYTKEIAWEKMTDYGLFEMHIQKLSFSLDLKIGDDSRGQPTMVARGCSSDVKSVKIRLSGKWGWLYNLFEEVIEKQVTKMSKERFCNESVHQVNVNGNKQLSKLKLVATLYKNFMLDYRLVSTPVFNKSYMETYHKGEIYWKTANRTKTPFSPPRLSTVPESTNSMLIVWLSDYVANSLVYVAHQKGYLAVVLSAERLPPANRSILNTTCNDLKCIGRFIPQLGKKYPNCQVKLDMKTLTRPIVTIHEGHIKMAANASLDLYVRLPNGTEKFVFKIDAKINTAVNVSLSNEYVTANFIDGSVKTKVMNSTIYHLDEKNLQRMVNVSMKLFIIPEINKRARIGLPLPFDRVVSFRDPKLTLKEGTVLLETNVHYQPKNKTDEFERHASESKVEDEMGPLPPVDDQMVFRVLGKNKRRFRHL